MYKIFAGILAIGHNLVEVVSISEREPKVGADAPTLGWRSQSRWDCLRPNAILFCHANESHDCFVSP